MKYVLFIIMIITVLLPLSAQEFQDQLETIVITERIADIQTVNNQISTTDFNLKKAIKRSKNLHQVITIEYDTTLVEISKKSYLKAIRKSANRSADSLEFLNVLSETLPDLEDLICTDHSFKELYETVRPQTINGKLDVLPSVL